jgi:hypothetical protein
VVAEEKPSELDFSGNKRAVRGRTAVDHCQR